MFQLRTNTHTRFSLKNLVLWASLIAFTILSVGCAKKDTTEEDNLLLLLLLVAASPNTATVTITNSSGGNQSYALHRASGCTDTPAYTFTPSTVANGSKTDTLTITRGSYYISVNTPRNANCSTNALPFTTTGRNYSCTVSSTSISCN